MIFCKTLDKNSDIALIKRATPMARNNIKLNSSYFKKWYNQHLNGTPNPKVRLCHNSSMHAKTNLHSVKKK